MSLEPVTTPPAVNGPTPEAYAALQLEVVALRDEAKAAVRKRRLEEELKPFQVELLKMQNHLEAHNQRMIVLFEGRDAAGKGGTIRRVTRYMNEKHYRVVALGKPTEEQRSQWYYQRYVAQFPTGGRWSSSTAVGTTGPWSRPSSASAPTRSTRTSCGASWASRRTSSARARSW